MFKLSKQFHPHPTHYFDFYKKLCAKRSTKFIRKNINLFYCEVFPKLWRDTMRLQVKNIHVEGLHLILFFIVIIKIMFNHPHPANYFDLCKKLHAKRSTKFMCKISIFLIVKCFQKLWRDTMRLKVERVHFEGSHLILFLL
jgi:hypothetical protein